MAGENGKGASGLRKNGHGGNGKVRMSREGMGKVGLDDVEWPGWEPAGWKMAG